ncbi:MAG: competence protein ComEA, partial [Patescibacteria group bacterium]
TGALENDGEKLELKDTSDTLIDSVDCSYGWFAGDNKTKETMERINPALPGSDSGNWASSTTSGGTPRAKNSVSLP